MKLTMSGFMMIIIFIIAFLLAVGLYLSVSPIIDQIIGVLTK